MCFQEFEYIIVHYTPKDLEDTNSNIMEYIATILNSFLFSVRRKDWVMDKPVACPIVEVLQHGQEMVICSVFKNQ